MSKDEFFSPRQRRSFPKKPTGPSPKPKPKPKPKPVYCGALDVDNLMEHPPAYHSNAVLTQEQINEAVATIEQVHQHLMDLAVLKNENNTKHFFPANGSSPPISRYPFIRGNRPVYIHEMVAGPQPELTHEYIMPVFRAGETRFYTVDGFGTGQARAQRRPRPPRELRCSDVLYYQSWKWVPEGYDYYGYYVPGAWYP